MPNFVHLRNHTEYSLVDGLLKVKPWIAATVERGMPAVALTDQNNLFALVKFYRAAIAAGIKPIIGADLLLENPDNPDSPFEFTLLCETNQGYKHLTELISRAYLEGQVRSTPIVQKTWLTTENCQGLIALSGALKGELGDVLLNKPQAAAQTLAYWTNRFPNRFFIELQRIGRPKEEPYITAALSLAETLKIPVVATNNVRFLKTEDFEAHEARVCIHDGYVLEDTKRPQNYTTRQYLRTSEEMCVLFKEIPEALSNSVQIAKLCNVTLSLGENFLPKYPTPNGETIEEHLRDLSKQGLEERFKTAGDLIPKEKHPEYHERLKIELDVIIQMGFPGYFLIVADFIQWSKHNGIPVGPGRGSGAGSLVAYALQITDVDPLQFDLLFERFLNPERISMPDFDVDFCMEGRDRVIDYVAEKYGRNSVSQIITYGKMAAKAVVRDVGRVLGHPYGFVDKIAKNIPFELGITLEKALIESEQLAESYQSDEQVRALIELAKKLEGVARNAGKHAGGVVIAPTVLTDFVPLYCEPGGTNVVTQFDKDDVEAIGLVKFDFLGLRTLTIIDWAIKAIEQTHGIDVDINQIPIDDEKTFDLIKAGNTTAVFQLESRGMKDLIIRLQPDCFEDIVALVALFRPGPLQSGMVDDFIDRKHGRAKITYPHPDLEPILKPTYGVILYQEQVMQIAQVLAGYSLGAADLLRRAMGKKKPEEMAKQREIFMEGSGNRDVDAKVASGIFDLMEKFAGYGFNKSHSVAYALIAYQTAWLKAHYPAAFMSAVLSSDMDNTDKVVNFIDDVRAMGMTVVPPHVNHSYYPFKVKDDNTIIYGLGAIKGVGQAAIEHIANTRDADGTYQDLFNFCNRLDTQKVNKRVLESLALAGALDELGPNRATVMASIATALSVSQQIAKDKKAGQFDLFSVEEHPMEDNNTAFVLSQDWPDNERLRGEKSTLGLYLTGHPIEQFLPELKIIGCHRIANLKPSTEAITTAGLVVGLKVMKTKRGDRMAFLTIDDQSARVDIVVFSENYQLYYDILAKDQILVVEGEVSHDDFTDGLKIVATKLMTVDQIRQSRSKQITLTLAPEVLNNDLITQLKTAIEPHCPGRCPIQVEVGNAKVHSKIDLGDDWKVNPEQPLINKLNQLLGKEAVQVIYS